MRWFVVTSQGRRVLGVFGSALEDEASRVAKRTELEAGLPAWVESFEGERPRIGDALGAAEPEERQRLLLGRLNRLSRAELAALCDREERAVPHPLHLVAALRKLEGE